MQGKIQQIQHHLNEAKEVSLKLLIEAKEVSLKLLIEVQWSCSPTAPWMYGRDEKCKVRFKDSTISMSLHEAKEISPKLLIEAKEVSRKLLASNQSIPCPYFEPSKLQSLSLLPEAVLFALSSLRSISKAAGFATHLYATYSKVWCNTP